MANKILTKKTFLLTLSVLFLVFSLSLISAGAVRGNYNSNSYSNNYNQNYGYNNNYYPSGNNYGSSNTYNTYQNSNSYNRVQSRLAYASNEEYYGYDSFHYSPHGYERNYRYGQTQSGYVHYDYSMEQGSSMSNRYNNNRRH